MAGSLTRYRASDTILIQKFDDRFAVYESSLGDTHVLDNDASDILRILLEESLSPEELLTHFPIDEDVLDAFLKYMLEARMLQKC